MSKYGMSDWAGGGDSTFVLDPGVYEMKLTSIESKEFENTNPQYGEVGQMQQRLVFTFVEEGADVSCKYFTSLSRGPKSKLFSLLKIFNGGTPLSNDVLASASEVEAYIDGQVGKTFQVILGHRDTEKGTFNTIESFVPAKAKGKLAQPTKPAIKAPLTSLAEDDLPF